MSDVNSFRDSKGNPILDADHPEVRKLALLMAETLGAIVRLDQISVVASDVLYALMRDALWARSHVDREKTPEGKERVILEAQSQILDQERYSKHMRRYVQHCQSIGSKSR